MMNHMKRTISVLLATLLLFAAAFSAHAAGTYFLYEGLYYGVRNGEAFIHGSDGTGWDIVISEQFLNRYNVTEVEEYAFFENDMIEALSFYEASHLRTLGDGAFSRCTKLQRVDVTSSIQELGMGVFDGCTALTYARFRENACPDIPRQCFYGCTALETVSFLNTPETIGPLAFGYCTALKQIALPDSVTQIADNAFEGCEGLVIYCTKESYALQYAIENGIKYVITNPDPTPEPVTYIIGDADGDGTVSILDATVIQRSLADLPVIYLDERAADIDGDGLTVTDATVIQRFLADLPDPFHIGDSASYLPEGATD